MPDFTLGYADIDEPTFYYDKPRAFYLDVFTKPGVVYSPLELTINVPETSLGNMIPAARVCSIEKIYVGRFVSCAEEEFSFYDQFVPVLNDKAVIKFNSLCNTLRTNATSDTFTDLNSLDSMIRYSKLMFLN